MFICRVNVSIRVTELSVVQVNKLIEVNNVSWQYKGPLLGAQVKIEHITV